MKLEPGETQALISRNTVKSAMTANTDKKTVAWYWEGLGLGRPAGLHWRQTDFPQGTVVPHRMHRS
jgi:hypothetical protein